MLGLLQYFCTVAGCSGQVSVHQRCCTASLQKPLNWIKQVDGWEPKMQKCCSSRSTRNSWSLSSGSKEATQNFLIHTIYFWKPNLQCQLVKTEAKFKCLLWSLSAVSFLGPFCACFKILSMFEQKVWCIEALWSVSTPPLILGVCSILQFSSYSSFGAVSLGLISLFLALAPFQAAPE